MKVMIIQPNDGAGYINATELLKKLSGEIKGTGICYLDPRFRYSIEEFDAVICKENEEEKGLAESETR